MSDSTHGCMTTLAGPHGAPDARVLLPSRYEDRGLIGVGATGSVRRVFDPVVGQTLAMKIMHPALLESVRARARFEHEATITARLRHPGIVAVHDRGALPDGRPWFAMTEVQGRTIAAVIAAVHAISRGQWRATEDGWTLRRLVDAFARLCQAVAHAHSLGVVHRDLKPANMMVGGFGEVLVMDWGLARGSEELDEGPTEAGVVDDPLRTRAGDVLGTPAYMPPEQARGDLEAVGPASDVYALGAVLFHLLGGRPPKQPSGPAWARAAQRPVLDLGQIVPPDHPPLPPGLCAISAQALRQRPEDRHPDAGALAAEVLAWLDGARRRDRAREMLADPRARAPRVEALRAEAQARRLAAAKALDAVPPFASVDEKRAGWALEDEATALEVEAAVEEAEWLRGVHAALTVAPELQEAHSLLAGHYRAQLRAAELRRDVTAAARYEALMRGHSGGSHTRFLTGLGVAEVHPAVPCEARLFRYVERDRRLVAEPVPTTISLPRLQLPRGSYLLELHASGHAPTRLPLAIRRGETLELRPRLLPASALGPDDIFVPAGVFWSGGDPDAPDALPGRFVEVADFVIRRYPVTVGEYRRFLDDLVGQGRAAEAERAAPQMWPTPPDKDAMIFGRDDTGRFVPPGAPEWADDHPVVFVDWFGARAYAHWLAEKTGLPWRLPNELEWEKAARGVDARRCPWGDALDATFARAVTSRAGDAVRESVYSFPADESCYGVRGMAGNVRDWCGNRWTHEGPAVVEGRLVIEEAGDCGEWRAARGGGWIDKPRFNRCAGRFAGRPSDRYGVLGFRIARAVRPAGATSRHGAGGEDR